MVGSSIIRDGPSDYGKDVYMGYRYTKRVAKKVVYDMLGDLVSMSGFELNKYIEKQNLGQLSDFIFQEINSEVRETIARIRLKI